MFQRQLSRQLVNLIGSASAPQSCLSCRCNCGKLIRHNVIPAAGTIPQRRYKYSPAVYRRNANRKPPAREEETTDVDEEASGNRWFGRWITQLSKITGRDDIRETTLEFVRSIVALARQGSGNNEERLLPREKVQVLLKRHGLNHDEPLFVAHSMMNDPRGYIRNAGAMLMYTLSEMDFQFATISIMRDAIVNMKWDPGAVQKPWVRKPWARLRSLAETDDIHYFKTLAGQVHFAAGNVDAALSMWWAAIPGAMKKSQDFLGNLETKNKGEGYAEEVPFDMFSPWIELANTLSARGEHDKALEAIELGIHMDDPVSHLQRARYAYEQDSYSSTWLFHITKAASAGNPVAAHELGLYYARAVWKYVDDEPGDAVKPTPFDSYPPNAPSPSRNFARRIFGSLGLEPLAPSTIFHSAAYPSTPAARMKMALLWLQAAGDLTFAPSYLAAAQLRLADTLWADSKTPKTALNMSSSRYTYRSEAEAQAGVSTDEQNPEADMEIPNPHRDPVEAKKVIRQVFYAAQAQRDIRRWFSRYARRTGENAQEALARSKAEGYLRLMSNELPEYRRKFPDAPEVREMYSDDDACVLFDKSQGIVDLEREACQICDTQKWDIYDDDGALIYRHGVGVARSGR